MKLPTLFCLFCGSFGLATAALDARLTGTWSTKSRKVVTGPDFYDPFNDRLKEPSHTGISYSFTDDGFFEQAYYRALPNPTRPDCPKGLMQFQHGKYNIKSNGSLVLTPFADDGRQLISDPCKNDKSSYYRYNQTEIFERFEVQNDPFHNVQRLNLYKFDGSPMNRMFLIYKPPQMLPTQTLNPIVTPSGGSKVKRVVRDHDTTEPLDRAVPERTMELPVNLDRWWWLGIIMASVGGGLLIFS
ncbi:Reversal of tor2 lethality [Myotisia sp. PD_48]|nr:Reversal of tor2 lethality [Myotisia sp. PD_48]